MVLDLIAAFSRCLHVEMADCDALVQDGVGGHSPGGGPELVDASGLHHGGSLRGGQVTQRVSTVFHNSDVGVLLRHSTQRLTFPLPLLPLQ